jgi:EmrB/QacA subfamily drug resistance transporter
MDDDGLKPRSPLFFLNEVARPAVIREWRHAPWLAVGAVCLGALMSQLDASIVTLAFPTLEHSFHVPLGAVTWIGLAYLLTVVSTLVLFGRISDMAGRKLIYIYGFVVFLVGSLLCGTAPTLMVLLASRVLQAVGGAMIQANSVAIVVLSLPVGKRTTGLGIQAAAQALGLALGPTIGGVLVGLLSWRWLFLVNIPVGLLALPASMAFIPRSRQLGRRQPLDWGGAWLLFLAVAGILVAFSLGGSKGWGSPIVLGGGVLGILAGVGLWFQERRTSLPLLSPALLRGPVVGRGLAAASLGYFVLFAFLLTVPFEVERAMDRSPAIAGLDLLALPLALGLMAPFAGRVASRLGPARAGLGASIIGGLGATIAGLANGSTAVLVLGLGILGAGLGVFNTVNNASVMGAIPPEQAAVGSGILNTVRGLGTACGLALGGALFAGLGGSSHADDIVQRAFRGASGAFAVLLLLAGSLSYAAGRHLRGGITVSVAPE